MDLYNKTKEEAFEKLSTQEGGLSSKEAQERLQRDGLNELAAKKPTPMIMRFLAQFKDIMIIILLIAAVISFSIAAYEGHTKEFFEPALILLIVVINAIIGVFQENKAEKALESLKSMSAPHARVIRDGIETVIKAKELVVGDIIKLEAGDFVPADSRLISTAALKAEEAALTGESLPSEKDADAVVQENAPLGDRHNMVFSGCSITYGTGKAVVVATGMNTQMGKIAGLLNQETDTQTPLQRKLQNLGKWLGLAALIACAIIFLIGLIDGIPLMEIFMTSISLAVSAIPEGLPAIVTIVLSIGIQRMVKRNAIIRKLPAVETLGSASIICSDKTGTLTQNRMTLKKVYVDAKEVEDVSDKNSADAVKLLTYATLCCDGSVNIENGKEVLIGDPTETAIVAAALKNGKDKESLNALYPRVLELPFDSNRKRMSTFHKIDGSYVMIVKGAFDIMAKRCIKGDLKAAEAVNNELSSQALRVIAVAYKVLDKLPQKPDADEIENELCFMGLVGMIDPPRPEVKEAVKLCRHAGIKPIMITGDHIGTAKAIAVQLDIFREGDRAITGAELDKMSDEELYNDIAHITVYARVSPENKIRIVKAWQAHDKVVAMTGDGVNDAPALKASDIGCAMGITGTDVAKGASDMILTDDNFATIVDAVREGRGIAANIKKVITFLLYTNVGEVLTVFFAMLLWQTSPLLSMQLLWVNLVTDSMPAIALGMEAVEPEVMNHKPVPKNEGIFAHGMGIKLVIMGAMFATFTLIGFYVGRHFEGSVEGGRTLAFMVLAMAQVVQAFNMRSDRSLFSLNPFSNKNLNIAAAISTSLMAIVLFTPVSIAFGLVTLSWQLYLVGVGLFIAPLFVVEIVKLIKKIFFKDKDLVTEE